LVKNGEFPSPVKITHRRGGWLLADVEEWIKSLPDRNEPLTEESNNLKETTNEHI